MSLEPMVKAGCGFKFQGMFVVLNCIFRTTVDGSVLGGK